MFRCVVLDDEPIIMRTVKNKIEMCNPDFQVVGIASDGQTGMEMILQQRPDCIFTDINMPVMNGLNMLEQIRQEEGYDPVVVIISGYTEFEYAQRALKMGAMDYLVKPISNEKVQALLERIEDRILQEKKRRMALCLDRAIHNGTTDLDQAFYDQTTVDRQLILTKLCVGQYFSQRFSHIRLEDRRENLIDIEAICQQCTGKRDLYHILYDNYSNEWTIIMVSDQTPEVLNDRIIRAIHKRVGSNVQITCLCIAGGIPLSCIRQYRDHLNDALRSCVVFGESRMLRLNGGVGNCLSAEVETALYRAIPLLRDNAYAGVVSAVRDVLEVCRQNHATQYQLTETIRRILSVRFENESADLARMADIFLCSCDNYDELIEVVLSNIKHKSIAEGLWTEEEPDSQAIIQQISEYIDKNYTQRILVQDIAKAFSFNSSYLCSLFRKYKGISPNEYIIARRMAHAKALLKNNADLSVKAVAESIGYEDPYYFSRVFRAYTGCSPSEYKKNHTPDLRN